MAFLQAIASVLTKYALFSGRAGRQEYWYWVSFGVILQAVFWLANVSGYGSLELGLLYVAVAFLSFLPGPAVMVRRLHDIDKSGWNGLWVLIPVFGWLYLLTLLVRPGTDGENRYPEDGASQAQQASAVALPFLLIGIVLTGASLRFNGLDWDQAEGAVAPIQMHPDERFISFVSNDIDWPGWGGYFDTETSPLNVYNSEKHESFVYGTLPLFLGKGLSTLQGDDPAGVDNSYGNDVVWGRRLTAFIDTLTIILVFGAGALLFGRAAGLVAAGAYAVAVFPVQLAHFWTVDPYVTFFTAASLLFSVLALQSNRTIAFGGWLLAAGGCVGLAIASKISGYPVMLAPGMAVILRVALRDLPQLRLSWAGQADKWRSMQGHWLTDLAILCLAAWISIMVFRIAQPYAFAGPDLWNLDINPEWWDDIGSERDRQSGDSDYPPFVQFAGRAPFLTDAKNIVLWGFGPWLAIPALAAALGGAVAIFRRRELTYAMPLVLLAGLFLAPGYRFVAFMRYFEPMYPILALFAGVAIVALWNTFRNRDIREQIAAALSISVVPAVLRSDRTLRLAASGALIVAIGGALWWAGAFQSVYRNEHPRIEASEWIYENVPPGSAITSEAWDDALPMNLPLQSNGQYVNISTDPYRTDTEEKIRQLIYGANGQGGLEKADFVAITSRRIRDTIPLLEREYPGTIRYYELLESGELGFELAAAFDSRPTFLGISIDDTGADESFTVYDHPEVAIYRKTDAWEAEEALALILEAHPDRATNLLPGQGATNGLQLTAEEAAVQQAGGTFSDIFDADGFASSTPWLWWLLWLEIAAFAVLPWVTWLFRALPDHGYGLSKVLGLMTVALTTWMLVAWDAFDFSGTLVWSVYFASLGVGIVVAGLRRGAFLADFRDRWRSWITLELVFLTVFAVFLLFRYTNPDLWHPFRGGEKPMELSYLTAVIRSTELPPFDPWFGGGTMNYYYMGWFFLAVPIRALRIVPEVAFNLAIPTFAALAASVGASTVHNLVGLAGMKPRVDVRRWSRPAALMAVVGAVFLIGMGNLDGADQMIHRLQNASQWSYADGVPVLGSTVDFFGGLYEYLFNGTRLSQFDWWRSSRVHFGTIDITEFPFWTLLFADLHPHLMGLPFFGLVIAASVAYAATAVARLDARAWLIAGLLGLTIGLVRTVHTWDFPTAVLLTVGAIAFGQAFALARWDMRWWRGVGHLALAGTMAVIPFAPYTAHFETFNPGIHVAGETTKAVQFFVQFGIFLFLGLAFIALRYREELRLRKGAAGQNLGLMAVAGPWEFMSFSLFGAGLALFSWQFGLTVVALSGLALLLLGNLLVLELQAKERDLARAMATALMMLAIGIAAGVDVVTINDDINRMNTVFKFGMQAWQLFAVSGAYALWYVARGLWNLEGLSLTPRPRRGLFSIAFTTIFAVFFVSSMIFVFSGTRARLGDRFAELPASLNGFDYLSAAQYGENVGTTDSADDTVIVLADDKPLIDWLRENVEGSPIIVEAIGPLYHWTGRITMHTGLPSVIGWDWHQTQQRQDYGHLVQQRRSDTQRFWTDEDPSAAERYLAKYNVRYIVVGTEEHIFGTEAAIRMIDGLPSVTEVFRVGDYAIYEVDQEQLLVRTR